MKYFCRNGYIKSMGSVVIIVMVVWIVVGVIVLLEDVSDVEKLGFVDVDWIDCKIFWSLNCKVENFGFLEL